MGMLRVLLTNCLLITHCTCLAPRIEDNGYRDVTVAFSSGDSRVLVSQMQELMEISSRVLYVATKRRSHFHSITFLLADHPAWLSRMNITVHQRNTGRRGSEDVDVLLTDELSREDPYTLQAEGCGRRGRRIYLPEKFVLSKEPSRQKGIEFVHHWAQYRYGVFSEGGFPDDDRYPLYYGVPGTKDVHVTACTNTELIFSFTRESGEPCVPSVNNETGALETPDCFVVPNVTSETLRSSIMYQQALPDVFEFCDSDFSLDKRHDPNPPSKHNHLCFEESPWIVILRNPDFGNGKNQATKYKPESVTFRFEKISQLRVVIAVDVSASMSQQGRYRLIKSALSKFVLLDVPLGSEIGLVFFDDGIIAATNEMVLLEDESYRVNLLESGLLPDEPRTTNSSCLACGTRAALQLLDDPLQNGIVVLITASPALTQASSAEDLRPARVQLFSVVFGDGANATALTKLSQQTGGSLTHIAEREKGSTLMHLFMFFSHVVGNEILFANRVSAEHNVTVSFPADSSVASISLLLFGPTFSALDSPLDEDETSLTSPTGDLVAMKKQYHIPSWMYLINSPEVGVYRFSTKWKQSPSDSLYVMAFATPSNVKSQLKVRAWTNAGEAVVDSTPVKVLAELTHGAHAVGSANVTAEVFNPEGELVSSFPLLDDGLGDPDITCEDGIYTRYFTQYFTPGYYSVFIHANDNDNQANILHVSSGHCCGSTMPLKEKKRSGAFTRLYGPFSFYVEGRSDDSDVFPPNRILDLRVARIENSLYTLRWSAAGDNLDQGGASRYQIKLFSEKTEAKRRFEDSGILLGYKKEVVDHKPPSQHGELQEFTVQLPDTLHSGRYYFAAKALDASSNAGQVSNIVEIDFQNPVRNWTLDCDNDPGLSPKFKSDPTVLWAVLLSAHGLYQAFLFLT